MNQGQRPHVLMLCTDFGYGGAERSFARTACLLAREFQVTCAVFNDHIAQAYPLPGSARLLDARPARWAPLRFLQRVRSFRRIARDVGADVSISFLEGADYVNFFAPVARRYASIRGSKLEDRAIRGWRGVLRRWWMRRLYPRFSGIVAVSRGLCEEMVTEFSVPRDRIAVIQNFYDLPALQAQAAEPLAPALEAAFARHSVWINVGRLHVQKNQVFLLHLHASLRENLPQARLALVGDGPEQSALERECHALGLRFSRYQDDAFDPSADVWLLGYQPNPHALVARSQLFLFPSLYEGFPNALVEAMACSVPVVSADCVAGPSEILDVTRDGRPWVPGSGGVLAAVPEVADEAMLATWRQAIAYVLREREALGRAAVARAGVYSEEAALARWRALLVHGPAAVESA